MHQSEPSGAAAVGAAASQGVLVYVEPDRRKLESKDFQPHVLEDTTKSLQPSAKALNKSET